MNRTFVSTQLMTRSKLKSKFWYGQNPREQGSWSKKEIEKRGRMI